MIRLWFTRGTSIPVREQLIAQLLLGILSRQLAPGEKLPSVRDLARRLRLHPNTISTVYKDLAGRGWLEARHGSGVFVRSISSPAPEMDLDVYIRSCLEEGLRRGFTLTKLEDGFRRIGKIMGTIRNFVVVDPDPELALILAIEIEEATNACVYAVTLDGATAMVTRMRETDTFVFATRRICAVSARPFQMRE